MKSAGEVLLFILITVLVNQYTSCLNVTSKFNICPAPFDSINRLIILLSSNFLEFLEFIIYPEIQSEECTEEHLLLFGRRLMSFLDDCPNAFRWLTRLTLCSMQFDDADIQNILNACKKLQTLCCVLY
jgi:hypothetical protein